MNGSAYLTLFFWPRLTSRDSQQLPEHCGALRRTLRRCCWYSREAAITLPCLLGITHLGALGLVRQESRAMFLSKKEPTPVSSFLIGTIRRACPSTGHVCQGVLRLAQEPQDKDLEPLSAPPQHPLTSKLVQMPPGVVEKGEKSERQHLLTSSCLN